MPKIKRLVCKRKQGNWSITTFGHAARGQEMILGHVRNAGPDLKQALESEANLKILRFDLMPTRHA